MSKVPTLWSLSMNLFIRASLFFCVAVLASCLPSVIEHNQNLAAQVAESFSHVVFVQKDFTNANSLVTGSGAIDEISTMAQKLHPSGKYPVSVVAVAYEPMPGKESMKIYLEGSGADPTYHYVAIMEGTRSKGYKVSAISRSEEPFPGSNAIKPLR